jgi:mRNA interferase RelE/StbE
MTRFIFSAAAKKDIQALDETVRRRIRRKLLEFEKHSNIISWLKKLADHPSAEYRLRIGDYRLLIDVEGDTVYVLRVRHRRDAYR